VIAIEACGASHHLARLLQSFGHTVKLIAPQLVKPYVKRSKNDAADAEALCEAMSRPTMRFVPVKTAEQQAALMLVGVRDRLIRNRTQLANSIRGYAAEFGLTAAKGLAHLAPLLERIQADETLPGLARELFASQAEEYSQLQAQLDEVDAKLTAWHRADECSRRLAKIPSVGPIGAVLLRMKAPDPTQFRSGRQFDWPMSGIKVDADVCVNPSVRRLNLPRSFWWYENSDNRSRGGHQLCSRRCRHSGTRT
jgi:transposase